MKKSIIKEVFYGNRGSSDSMRATDKELELIKNVLKAYEAMSKTFTNEQKQLYEKFIDAKETAFCEEAENYYVEGFKLGLLMGIECTEE